jgi:hypothetical protein
MRVAYIILTAISAASAIPVPVQTNFDLGYDDLFLDPGSDESPSDLASVDSTTSLFDSNDPLLIAGNSKGKSSDTPPVDPVQDDVSWTDPKDESWTGANRPSSHSDGSYQHPANGPTDSEKGGDSRRPSTITTEMGAPTNLEISPDQADAIINTVSDGASWVIEGLSTLGAPIKALGEGLGEWVPSGGGI